jgi:hypothetical protein
MPMYKFLFPEKISQKELESQVKEILLGQRKANGPIEYKIVPKNVKSNALLCNMYFLSASAVLQLEPHRFSYA